MREAYACKRNDDKGNKGVKDEEKASVQDVARRRTESEIHRGEGGSEKKRESINRGRVTGNRRYREHRHVDKCLVHRLQLPTCLEGHLCPDDIAIIKGGHCNLAQRQLYIFHRQQETRE